MGKDTVDPPSFYSPIGERIKRWWKNLERYGFDISIAEFDNKNVEYENYGKLADDEFFVGDQFEKGNNFNRVANMPTLTTMACNCYRTKCSAETHD